MAEQTGQIAVGDLIGEIHRQRNLFVFWVLALLVALVDYSWTLRDLILGWIATGRLVLGLAILAGAILLVRDRWEKVRREAVVPSRWGFAFLALSFLLLFIGTRANLVFVQGMTSVFLRGLSAVALLCGVVVLVAGWRMMKHLWMPALLLCLLYPENALTTYWVPLRLQTLAAVASQKTIALLGIPVVRQGHVLETVGFVANVEEACSGIRSLSTVVPAAVFVSAYGLRKVWTKAALVVLAVPVTILANIIRVVITTLVASYVSPKVAQGFFHYFAGFGIFVFCLVLLVVLWQILQDLEKGHGAADDAAGDGPASDALPPKRAVRPGRTALRRSPLWVGGFLILGIVYQASEVGHVLAAERRTQARPLAAIPMQIGKWTAKTLPDPPELDRQRHVSDALYRQYSAPGEPPIDVALLYWRTGEGTFLGRRAHLPESCYPYHGMAQRWTRTRVLQTGSSLMPEVEVTVSAFSQPQRGSIVVTSWQQVGLRAGPIERRAYEGKLGQLVYGMREVLRLKSDYPAEIALQFSASAGEAEEWVASAEERLAPAFITLVLDQILATSQIPQPSESASPSSPTRGS